MKVSGIINIILGGLMVAGGLSGKFALLGTNSGLALAAIGGVVGGYGIYQLTRDQRG